MIYQRKLYHESSLDTAISHCACSNSMKGKCLDFEPVMVLLPFFSVRPFVLTLFVPACIVTINGNFRLLVNNKHGIGISPRQKELKTINKHMIK